MWTSPSLSLGKVATLPERNVFQKSRCVFSTFVLL